jgi:hypothetical protein
VPEQRSGLCAIRSRRYTGTPCHHGGNSFRGVAAYWCPRVILGRSKHRSAGFARALYLLMRDRRAAPALIDAGRGRWFAFGRIGPEHFHPCQIRPIGLLSDFRATRTPTSPIDPRQLSFYEPMLTASRTFLK